MTDLYLSWLELVSYTIFSLVVKASTNYSIFIPVQEFTTYHPYKGWWVPDEIVCFVVFTDA